MRRILFFGVAVFLIPVASGTGIAASPVTAACAANCKTGCTVGNACIDCSTTCNKGPDGGRSK